MRRHAVRICGTALKAGALLSPLIVLIGGQTALPEPRVVVVQVQPPAEAEAEADDVLISWVHRDSVKFGGGGTEIRLIIRQDGIATVPGGPRERESRVRLPREQIDSLIALLVEEQEIGTIVGPWFNGRPNLWTGSQEQLFVRDGANIIRLTCEYGWPSGSEHQDATIRRYLEAQNTLSHVRQLVQAGGREAVAAAVPIANQALKEFFPETPPLTIQDFSFGENFPAGHRRITFVRETEREGTVDPVRVEVIVPDEGPPHRGDVTVANRRVRKGESEIRTKSRN